MKETQNEEGEQSDIDIVEAAIIFTTLASEDMFIGRQARTAFGELWSEGNLSSVFMRQNSLSS